MKTLYSRVVGLAGSRVPRLPDLVAETDTAAAIAPVPLHRKEKRGARTVTARDMPGLPSQRQVQGILTVAADDEMNHAAEVLQDVMIASVLIKRTGVIPRVSIVNVGISKIGDPTVTMTEIKMLKHIGELLMRAGGTLKVLMVGGTTLAMTESGPIARSVRWQSEVPDQIAASGGHRPRTPSKGHRQSHRPTVISIAKATRSIGKSAIVQQAGERAAHTGAGVVALPVGSLVALPVGSLGAPHVGSLGAPHVGSLGAPHVGNLVTMTPNVVEARPIPIARHALTALFSDSRRLRPLRQRRRQMITRAPQVVANRAETALVPNLPLSMS